MSDLIERQTAIDAVLELSEKMSNEMLFIDAIVDEIENLPSAEPERKKGEWIKEKENVVLCYCSECGYKVASALSNLFYNYCPNCGAEMRGE